MSENDRFKPYQINADKPQPRMQFINEIQTYFEDIDSKIVALYQSITDNNTEYRDEIFTSLKGSNEESNLFIKIQTCLIEKREFFRSEIKYNTYNNLPGGTKWVELVINRRFINAKKFFPEVLKSFLDHKQLPEPHNKNYSSFKERSKNMLKIIGWRYLDSTAFLEETFQDVYTVYEPKITRLVEPLTIEKEISISPIALKYKDIDKVIDYLYKEMNGTCIKYVDRQLFENHFTKRGNFEKLIWKMKDNALNELFINFKFAGEDKNPRNSVMLQKFGVGQEIIQNHFCKQHRTTEKRKDYTATMIRNNFNKHTSHMLDNTKFIYNLIVHLNNTFL